MKATKNHYQKKLKKIKKSVDLNLIIWYITYALWMCREMIFEN